MTPTTICSTGSSSAASSTSGSAERVEPLGVASADLRAGFVADVRPRAQMLCALGPFAVPVRVVAGEHDEVVAEHVDDTGQDRLLRLAGRPDVPGLEVFLRIASPAVLDPVAALLEVLVQAVDEERHPADACLQERDAQPWMPVEDTARDQRRHRGHLVERKAD